MKKNYRIILLFSLAFFCFLFGKDIKASTSDNVWGYAWSENIGWISFNCYNDYNGDGNNESHCTDTGYSSNYGVNISSSGLFSGYAWSENIGWISFNQAELVGCPNAPCETRADSVSGQISGWARALAYGGGWDGWIKLRGNTQSGDSYGVSINSSASPAEFNGWAWGGDDDDSEAVIGWISFNDEDYNGAGPSDYQVLTSFSFDTPPIITPVDPVLDYCDPGDGVSSVNLTWTYFDPGDSQDRYKIQVIREDDGSLAASSIDGPKKFLISDPSGSGPLYYDTDYEWQFQVKDSDENWWPSSSTWFSGPQFHTGDHAGPSVHFDAFQTNLNVSPGVQFCSVSDASIEDCDGLSPETTFYGIDPNQRNWDWDFDGDGLSDLSGNNLEIQDPPYTYSKSGTYTALLVASDEVGSCQATRIVQVGSVNPIWKEVPPIIRIKNFFAGIAEIFVGIF